VCKLTCYCYDVYTLGSALRIVAIAVATTDRQIAYVKASGRKRRAEGDPTDSKTLKAARLDDGHHEAQENDPKRRKLSDYQHKSIWWEAGWWDWDEHKSDWAWIIDGDMKHDKSPIVSSEDGTMRGVVAASLRRPATSDFHEPQAHPAAAEKTIFAASSEQTASEDAAGQTPTGNGEVPTPNTDAENEAADKQEKKDGHATYMRFYRSIRSGRHSTASLYTVCVLHQTLV
jgi:hypothetical protein